MADDAPVDPPVVPATQGHLTSFNPENESPDDYHRRFKLFVALNDQVFGTTPYADDDDEDDVEVWDNRRRRYFLLHLQPKEAALLSRSVLPQDVDELSVADLLAALKSLYSTGGDGYTDNLKLSKRCQQPNETVKQFVAAITELAQKCDYSPATRESVLKDRLVFGVRSEAIRAVLVDKKHLSFAEASTLAQRREEISNEVQFIADQRTEKQVFKVESETTAPQQQAHRWAAHQSGPGPRPPGPRPPGPRPYQPVVWSRAPRPAHAPPPRWSAPPPEPYHQQHYAPRGPPRGPPRYGYGARYPAPRQYTPYSQRGHYPQPAHHSQHGGWTYPQREYRQPPSDFCWRCGKRHSQSEVCPALYSTCYACRERGHTAQYHYARVHHVEAQGPDANGAVALPAPESDPSAAGAGASAPVYDYDYEHYPQYSHPPPAVVSHTCPPPYYEAHPDPEGNFDEAYVADYFSDLSLHECDQDPYPYDPYYYNCNKLESIPFSPPDETFQESSFNDEEYAMALTQAIQSAKDSGVDHSNLELPPLSVQDFLPSEDTMKIISEDYPKLETKLSETQLCLQSMKNVISALPLPISGSSTINCFALDCPPIPIQMDSTSFIHSLETVNSLVERNEPEFVTLNIGGQLVQAELDTGSGVTIFHSSDFFKYFPSTQLLNSFVKVRGLTGHSMEIDGKIQMPVLSRNRSYTLTVTVGTSPLQFQPILGRDWLDILKPGWRSYFKTLNSVPTSPEEIKCHKIISSAASVEIDKLKLLYPNVFSSDRSTSITGFTASVIMKENAQPVKNRAYPVPYSMSEDYINLLRKSIQDGHYQQVVDSEWASPAWPVKKPDGSLRNIVDFKRTVNPNIELGYYPLPVPSDIFTTVGGSKIFCVIDLSEAFLQLELDVPSRKILTINTPLGLLQPTRLQFGVASAPMNFQCVMDQILNEVRMDLKKNANLTETKMVAYIDDIVLGAKSKEELDAMLNALFKILSSHNVRIREDKCQWYVDSIEYLGHRIDSVGIHTLEKRVKPIRDAPVPKNVAQLRSFLGSINFYRKFLPKLADTLHVFHELLQKGVKWNWSPECDAAFAQCKELILKHATLTHYDPNLPIVISTDASGYGVAGMLAHRIDNVDRPVLYFSSSLSPVQQKYPQIEREALAIVLAISHHFHKYVYGRDFTLVTDSAPLKVILSPAKDIPVVAAMRIQHWALTLSAYKFKIEYRKSELMGLPDTLSRLPLPEVCVDTVGHLSVPYSLPLNSEIIAAETLKDEVFSTVLTAINEDKWPTTIDSKIKPYFDVRYVLSVHNNCLVFGDRVCVPPALRTQVLELLHDGHPGATRMKMRAKLNVWWPNLNTHVEQHVASCEPCAIVNFRPPKFHAKWPDTLETWARLHLDFFFFDKNVYLILIDSHSKWLDIWLLSNTAADIVIETLYGCFSVLGFPLEIVTDNGPPFTSFKFIEFCSELNIVLTHSPPYNPPSNGLAERWVQISKKGLRKLLLERNKDSIKLRISKFLLANRNTPCTTTGLCPSQLVTKNVPRTNLTVLKPPILSNVSPYYPKAVPFQKGDKVLVRQSVDKQVVHGTILQAFGPMVYEVSLPSGVAKVSVNQMTLDRTIPQHTPTAPQTPAAVLPPPSFPPPFFVNRPPPPFIRMPVRQPQPRLPIVPQRPNQPIQDNQPLRRSTRERRNPQRYGQH